MTPPLTLESVRRTACAWRSTNSRIDQYLLKLRRLADQQKQWAQKELDECLSEGARQRLQRWSREAHPGPAGRTSVGGVLRKSENGQQWEQAEFETMTREELVSYRELAVHNRDTWGGKIAQIDWHLDLLDKAPDAETSAGAAEQLGIDLTEYLRHRAAS